MKKDELLELSKLILYKNNEKIKPTNIINERFSNNSQLEKIIKKIGGRNTVIVLGINPAGNEKNVEFDKDYYEYITNKNMLNMLKKLNSEEININYFKSNYELFNEKTTSMTWVLKDEKKLREKFGKSFDENYYKRELDKKNILVFCDLIYYHDTDSKIIKDCIYSCYKTSKEKINKLEINDELKNNVIRMLDKHIKMLEPILIVVTNSFASKLICASLEQKSVSELYYKKTPIILAGMVSGKHSMDIFSKERLKKDIKNILE